MSKTMVWEPAEGLAIARCQAARFRDPAHRETADHPSSCQWCIYPDPELGEMVQSFNAWAGHQVRKSTVGKPYDTWRSFEVQAFHELKHDVQRALITTAQELTGEPWPPRPAEEPMPMPSAEPTRAEQSVPERPPWL